MAQIKLAEIFDQWASDFVDMDTVDNGEEKLQVVLKRQEIEALIKLLEGLKRSYDVADGIQRDD
jgi:hypothetical protein|tara:strand:- start:207 stop:398 length:192 start_codon:yes stop_codon:yes gene_type:complete